MSKEKTPADPHAVTVEPWPETDRIAPADAQLAVDKVVAAHNRRELDAAAKRLGVRIVRP